MAIIQNVMMKIFRIFLNSLFLSVFSLHAGGQCLELVWSEEFDYTGLPDPDIWSFETGAGGWGNNELQYYKAADSSNAWVENGTLVIKAKEESVQGSSYTSTRIVTRDLYEFRYGRIEARIRLPFGQGIWPAFWLLGANHSEVGWPGCGEIDVMEMIGGPGNENTVHGTAHWDNNGSHAQYGGNITLPSGIFADDFHLFSVEWNASSIKWFMDGILYHTLNTAPSSLDEFRNPFYIILNIAVGGDWPQYPDETTVFPQRMEVDYIRVYQADNPPAIQGDSVVVKKKPALTYRLPFSEDWQYRWSVPVDADIVDGEGTEEITVNWGCEDGEVTCALTGTCGTYQLSLPVVVDARIHGPVFFEEGAGNLLFYVNEMPGTSFEWSVPGDATILQGQGTDSIRVNWGSAFLPLSVVTTGSCGTDTTIHRVYRTGQYPYPDPAIPHPIPGIINATEYDYGGEGIAYHDLTPINEGPGPRQEEAVDTEYRDDGHPTVGWIEPGEWLEYSIQVDSSGDYDLTLRASSEISGEGSFTISVNGEQRLGPISVRRTGSWDTFISIRPGVIALHETDTLIRLDIATGDFNLGRLEFEPHVPTFAGKVISGGPITIYPNPAREQIHIAHADQGFVYEILGLDGTLRLRGASAATVQIVRLDKLNAGSYVLILRPPGGNVATAHFIRLP